MIIRPFRADDVFTMQQHPTQLFTGSELPESVQRDMYKGFESGIAITMIFDGEIIFCGGVTNVYYGRHAAWSVMGINSGKHMTAITKTALACIESAEEQSIKDHGWSRVEAYIVKGFNKAERWARMLGFGAESVMSRFNPDGSDAIMFVRVK